MQPRVEPFRSLGGDVDRMRLFAVVGITSAVSPSKSAQRDGRRPWEWLPIASAAGFANGLLRFFMTVTVRMGISNVPPHEDIAREPHAAILGAYTSSGLQK